MSLSSLTQIAFDWGVRCFGFDHMHNKPLRALRCAEEAIELAQSLGVPDNVMHHLVDVVYSRPRGDEKQELGGVLVTAAVLCELLGTSIEDVFETEIRRCLSKPQQVFAQRNQDKITLGLDAS